MIHKMPISKKVRFHIENGLLDKTNKKFVLNFRIAPTTRGLHFSPYR